MRNVLPLLTDDEITKWLIEKLKDKKYSPDIIENLMVISSTYETNQKNFEQDIKKGIVSKLPPSDPYAASKFVFEKSITEPMGDVNFGAVFDENDKFKGFQISVDGQPLEVWCEKNGVNPNDYFLVLQIYFEDILRDMDISMENGYLKRLPEGILLDSNTVFSELQNQAKHKKIASELQSKGFLQKDKQLIFARTIAPVEPKQKQMEQPSAGPTGA
jgi:hypothetical protein